MHDEEVLKLSSVNALHPRLSILNRYGPATIVRLRRDPVPPLQPDTTSRVVKVDWISRVGDHASQQVSRRLSWDGVPENVLYDVQHLIATANESDITEEAAIGVMALLVHNLEHAQLLGVLPIGSGGDYALAIVGLPTISIEVSGIRVDSSGSESRARLNEKSLQVLGKHLKEKPLRVRKTNLEGFAFVAAFSHGKAKDVHCYFHHVRHG